MIKLKILISPFLIFFLSISSLLAQIEEDLPAFEDHSLDLESVEELDKWPGTNDTIRFSRNRKLGFVCNKTEVLIPFEYTDLPQQFAKLMVAKKDGKAGVINSKNEIILPFEYDGVLVYDHCFIVYKKNDSVSKYGIAKTNGEILLPVKFDRARPYPSNLTFGDQKVIFSTQKKEGGITNTRFYTESGELIKKVPYREYFPIGENYIRVKNSKFKYGLLNKAEEVVLPCSYTHLYWVEDEIACVHWNKQSRLISLKDKSIIEESFYKYEKPDQNGNIVVYKNIGKEKHYGIYHLDKGIVFPLKEGQIYNLPGTDIYGIKKNYKIIDLIDADGKQINDIKPFPLQIKGMNKGYYATQDIEGNWMVFNAERVPISKDKFLEVVGYHRLSKQRIKGIDKTNLLGKVNHEGEQYWLFSNGDKVKI